ncbi:MAG: DUF4175 family protein [Acidobacteriota bacterium]
MDREYQRLKEQISEVRQRFRWIVLAKGMLVTLTGSLAGLVLAVILVDHWNYSDAAITFGRMASLVLAIALLAWFVVRPLLRKVGDVQIARYIEERNPSLQERLVSAVEMAERERNAITRHPFLPLLVRDAVQRSQHIQAKSLFNPREPFLSGAVSLALIALFVFVQVFGPSFFQYATLKLYAGWMIPNTDPLYQLEVSPGNIKIRKGSDQVITTRLIGFDAREVAIYSRYESGGAWQVAPMESSKESNAFSFIFLDVNEKIHYYVQAGSVKSHEYTISVVEVPRVERINLTYRFPAYTGLPTKFEEDGGDIYAVKGTVVLLEAQTSADAASARIVLEDGTASEMQKSGISRFRGEVTVRSDSAYRIELTDFSGEAGIASHEYSITALEDQPPIISILKPGRDRQVTKLEEVLTEVKADDDFGVNSLELHYTINGGPEQVVHLFKPEKGSSTKSISGTHTFFLEEYDLEPGDFLTYFARAADSRTTTTSDIYFLEVRTFGKEYSQSQMSGGGGGAGEVGSVLSARQKEILSATWRLIRDQKTFSPAEYRENLKIVAGQQLKLRQQTQSLADRMERRALVSRDKQIQKLSENLVKAIESMGPAHRSLAEEKPKEAISPEQVALQHLMRAEAFFREVQVAFGNSSGQGGQNAQELENLFELELDKLKNQYETLQQQNSSQAGAELDEALEKLKELARRQQQMNERRRQAQMAGPHQPGGSAGSNQAALRQELEKLARQLERLSRNSQNEELARASQQLRQAAQEMRNTSGGGGESQNRGLQALSRMNDARRTLENQRRTDLSEDIKNLQASAEELARLQEKIRSGLESLSNDAPPSEGQSNGTRTPKAGERIEREFHQKRQVLQNKMQLKKDLGALEQNLYGAARRAADQQKTASRKLQSAGNSLRDNRVQEKVDLGGQLIARGFLEAARQREEAIQQMIDDVQQKIAEADKQVRATGSESAEERLGKALSQTGDLLAGLESLSRRVQQLQKAARQGRGEPKEQAPSRGQGPHDLQQRAQEQDEGAHSDQGQGPTQGTTNEKESAASGRTSAADSRSNESRSQGQQPVNPGNGRAKAESRSDHGANGSAEGRQRPDSNPEQLSSSDSDRQYHGTNSRGAAAVNFGDQDLPPPGQLTPGQARQLQKEYELRLKEAQEIGKNLHDHRELAAQVRDMVERMRKMSSLKFLHDEAELSRLRSSVIEGFRELELNLSRNLQNILAKENLHLAKDEDVPEPYRKQVEEYYKALSHK